MSTNNNPDDRDESLPIDGYDDLPVDSEDDDDLETHLENNDYSADELKRVKAHEQSKDDPRVTAVRVLDRAIEDADEQADAEDADEDNTDSDSDSDDAEAQEGGPDVDPEDDPAVDETTDEEPANPHGKTEDESDVGEQNPRADAVDQNATPDDTTRTGEPPEAQPTRTERNQAAQTPGTPSVDTQTTRTGQTASATDRADLAVEETPGPVEPTHLGQYKAGEAAYVRATSVALNVPEDFELPDPNDPGAPDTLRVEVPGAMGVAGVQIDAAGSYEFPYAASEAPPEAPYSAMRLKRDLESDTNQLELSTNDPIHPAYDDEDDEIVGDVVGR